jgi:hypothetical protein
MDDDIYSELIRVPLNDEVVSGYEALLYSWGGEMLTHSMPVNDCLVKIMANIFDAILHLRDKEGKRTIWIDAVCINYRDMAERNRQVLYMGKIYSTVRQVVIWVGKEEHGGDPGLAILARNLEDLNLNQLQAVAASIF